MSFSECDMLQKLAKEWMQAGVKEGDTILIHSNIKRTFKRYLKMGYKLTPQDILESFIIAVGTSGTLLFPIFNFDFTEGIPFDIRNSPSHMGALTEAARKHPLAVRTGHPIYSFVAIGAKAKQFNDIDNFSGYGDDSPFAVLKSMNGKISVLDLPDQNSMTFYHHIEEINQVDYRYHKKFTADYTDSEGVTTSKTYGLFVRNVEQGVLTHVNLTGEMMWKNHLYSGDRPKQACGLRTISAQDMFDFVTEVISSGKSLNNLYRLKGN